MSVVLVADTSSPSSILYHYLWGEEHTTQLSALATFHTWCWSGARGNEFLSHYTPAPAHNSYTPDCASWWDEEREEREGGKREREKGSKKRKS